MGMQRLPIVHERDVRHQLFVQQRIDRRPIVQAAVRLAADAHPVTRRQGRPSHAGEYGYPAPDLTVSPGYGRDPPTTRPRTAPYTT